MVISFDEVLRRAELGTFLATLEDWEAEAFDERAAIFEFEAGLSRLDAEKAAAEMIARRLSLDYKNRSIC